MAREFLTPPGDRANHFALENASADNGRSIFDARTLKSGLILTPSDELTGLPLPILPSGTWINSDWHHHFHPRRSPLLEGVAGTALRNARLQKADYHIHHNEYHKWFTGPALPVAEDGIFALTVMAIAGYMPKQAITFKHGKPRVVALKPEVWQRLQTSGEIKVGSREAVHKFMRHFVLQQDIDALNINNSTIDEFVNTADLERRRELGHMILGRSAIKAAEPVEGAYSQARRKALLLPNTATCAPRFIKSCLGTMRIRDKLVHQLHASIAMS